MAKITKIHETRPAEDSGMGEYKKKLFVHRAGVGGRLLVIAAVILCAVAAFRIWYANKMYTSYEVVSSSEHTATVDTVYQEYNGNILKYSRDGVSCVNRSNEALWSQTYNMQSPVVDISGDEVVVADKSGNEAYVFDSDGLQTQISTLMPISQVSISSGGVTAVMVDDGSSSYIYIYDSAGSELAEIKCSIEETGQPLAMAISPDGAKLAVAYLQVQSGQADSCLVFYNFGSVGSNYVDKIVSSKLYSGEIIPRIEYMTNSLCVAVSDSHLIYFEGDEIPEEETTVEIGTDILSVFFGENRVGIIVDAEEAAEIETEVEDAGTDESGTEDGDEADTDESGTEDEDEADTDESSTEDEDETDTDESDTEDGDEADTDESAADDADDAGVTDTEEEETDTGDDAADFEADVVTKKMIYSAAASGTGGDGVSKYEIWVFDSNGKRIRTIDTDFKYDNAKFSGKTIILYGEDECEIYSGSGVLKYSGSLDGTISCIFKYSRMQKFVVVYADSTDVVKLQ